MAVITMKQLQKSTEHCLEKSIRNSLWERKNNIRLQPKSTQIYAYMSELMYVSGYSANLLLEFFHIDFVATSIFRVIYSYTSSLHFFIMRTSNY